METIITFVFLFISICFQETQCDMNGCQTVEICAIGAPLPGGNPDGVPLPDGPIMMGIDADYQPGRPLLFDRFQKKDEPHVKNNWH
jgi:hypothetical protein